MTPHKIHVHSQTDKSTIGFLTFMWETMLSLASRPELLQLTCHCIGPAAIDRIGSLKQVTAVLVEEARGDDMHGSNGHGACVEHALRMTDDGDIHIICDADTVIIAKGWDDYVRIRLINDRIGIIGATYEEPGGFSSGGGSCQTYKKIPNAVWMALAPQHSWRSLRAKPRKEKPVTIKNELDAKIYNLPIGNQVLCDVGWQVPQHLHDHKIKYDGWRQLKPSKSAIVLTGLTDYHEEYHAGGTPFLVHHRGSMKHAYRTDKMSRRFYEAVDIHIVGEHLHDPKWTWEWQATAPEEDVPVNLENEPIPEPEEAQVEPVRTFKDEWLKISFNGSVTRARDRLTDDRVVHADNIALSPTQVGHMRIEGVIRSEAQVSIAGVLREPYAITFRNATESSLKVCSGGKQRVVIPAGESTWILIDVDGVQRVT